MNHHDTDVRVSASVRSHRGELVPARPLYAAHCSCGWSGLDRLSRAVAEDDAYEHVARLNDIKARVRR